MLWIGEFFFTHTPISYTIISRMHIYFTGTKSAKNTLKKEYQIIYSELLKKGHTVWGDEVMLEIETEIEVEELQKDESINGFYEIKRSSIW